MFARFEERFESFMEGLGNHARELAAGFAILLVLGAIAAWLYERSADRRAEGFAALARIEREFASKLPDSSLTAIPEAAEPGVADAAQQARVAALAAVEALLAKERGSAVAGLAQLRAASLEVDLGRLEAADARLAALAEDTSGTLRGSALRLRGYVLEELGRPQEAGQAYNAAAQTTGFASRAEAYLSAGEVFERIGDLESAQKAFTDATAVLPELEQSPQVVERIQSLRTRIAASQGGETPAGAAPAE